MGTTVNVKYSGFAAGLLVSVFSKTLVLLAGLGMVVIQVLATSLTQPFTQDFLLFGIALPYF